MEDVSMKIRFVRSIVFALSVALGLGINMGMRFAGAPGDCAVVGNGWTSSNGGCQDPSGRVWAASRMGQGGPQATYSQDRTYCADLVEGGYDDWRLPTTAEFRTAVGYSAAAHLNLPDQGWGRWLSETKGKMWGYGGVFQNGSINQTLQTSTLDVMCVR